jgi:hypothetical protein
MAAHDGAPIAIATPERIDISNHRIRQMDNIDTEVPCSFFCFVASQGIKRKQDLTGLAPKGCLIAASRVRPICGVPDFLKL